MNVVTSHLHSLKTIIEDIKVSGAQEKGVYSLNLIYYL